MAGCQEVLDLFCCLEEKPEEICKILQELHTALTRAMEPRAARARGPSKFHRCAEEIRPRARQERGKGRMREINFTGPEARERKCAKSCPTCTFPASYPVIRTYPRCMEFRSPAKKERANVHTGGINFPMPSTCERDRGKSIRIGS